MYAGSVAAEKAASRLSRQRRREVQSPRERIVRGERHIEEPDVALSVDVRVAIDSARMRARGCGDRIEHRTRVGAPVVEVSVPGLVQLWCRARRNRIQTDSRRMCPTDQVPTGAAHRDADRRTGRRADRCRGGSGSERCRCGGSGGDHAAAVRAPGHGTDAPPGHEAPNSPSGPSAMQSERPSRHMRNREARADRW